MINGEVKDSPSSLELMEGGMNNFGAIFFLISLQQDLFLFFPLYILLITF